MDNWKKFSQVGIFLGNETFTPVRFIHDTKGSGRIKWKYFNPLSKERPLTNISKTVLGREYEMYVNDRLTGKKVQVFNMDIHGKPSYTHLPPSLLRINSGFKAENDYLKGLVSDMRKQLYDRANKDRLMKEAIRLGGFRKDFIDAGMTGAEQFGGGSRFGGFGGFGSSLGLPPRTL